MAAPATRVPVLIGASGVCRFPPSVVVAFGTTQRSVTFDVGEQRGQIPSVGEQPDDVDLSVASEVEPDAGKPDDPPDPQTRNPALLPHSRRTRPGHAPDGTQPRDRGVEEPLPELVAAFAPVVARALHQVDLGERPQPDRGHTR